MNVCSNMGKHLACPAYCRLVSSVIMAGRNPLKLTFRHFSVPPATKGKLVTQPTPIATVDELKTDSIGKAASKLKLQTASLDSDTKEAEEDSNAGNMPSQSPHIQSDSQIVSESSILQAVDAETLLKLSSSRNLSLRQACLLVSSFGRMARKGKLNVESLKNEQMFVSVCNLVLRGNHSQQPHSLLLAIYGFRHLGFSSDSELQKTLESELKWCMRRCPIKFLARAVDMFSEEDSNWANAFEDESSLLHTAVETLQRRWVEVTTGSDFILVFKVIHMLSDDTKTKLEDRAVEMIPDFTPMEMVKLLIILGVQKIRPTPLLRAVSFHLSKKEAKIPIRDLIELVYALNELTFCEPILMAKLSESIVEQIPSVNNSALICSLVTSLGQMRYKHKDLIQTLEEWISKHTNDLRTFDCASFLLTSAVLNIPAENNSEFYVKAKTLLAKPLQENPVEWANIVHSFAVLDQCTPELLSSVLQPDFIKHIDANCGKATTPLIKLLHLNAMAKYKLVKGYNGPLIDKAYVSKWTAEVRPSDRVLSKVLLETLGNFLPLPKYLKSNKQLDSGVYLDAVCVFNEKWDPVPVDLGNMKKDWTKVAIMLLGYPSLCLGIKEPTGHTLLSVKLLEREGYKVVTVPYTEFNAQEKIVKRVQYLEQKIKSVSNTKRSDRRESTSSR